MTSNEPPMNFEHQGKITGLITEYVELLRQDTPASEPIKLAPWARVLEAGRTQPNTMIFSTEKSPSRSPNFHWVGPIMAKRWFFLAKHPEDYSFNTLDDYKQVENIGVLRADNRESWLLEQGFDNLYPVNNLEQAYKMLQEKRLDIVLTGDVEHSYMVRYFPEFNNLHGVFDVNVAYSYLAFSKFTCESILQAWQHAFEANKNHPQLQEMKKKWGQHIEQTLVLKDGMFSLAQADSVAIRQPKGK
nr:transporter substrate-binding domain-containing protein [Motilimonas pumila]